MRELRKLLLNGSLVVVLALCTYAIASDAAYADNEPAAAANVQPQEVKEEGKHPHHRHRHFRGGHIVTDTAELLGIEPKTLVEELKQGKSLLQVVQARKGWNEAEYVQKLTVMANRHIDKAIDEGKLSKEKAGEIKTKLPAKLKKVVNRTWNSPAKENPVTEFRHNTIQWPMTE
ncbi:hypothetical protein [Paenibacillus fonticola]|uniref:hypothetical protein n=1 Tax=Paenibacillus fonticola TaxID=379896 RepID=UPI0005241C63|nr:hypothetical protein [Paenibacillus fonticola]